MRADGGESVCEGPGNGRRVEILLKTKVVFGKDVVGSLKIKSCGGGGGGTGKERNEKSQVALASGRFGGSSDLIDTWLTPAHPPSFGERRPLISPGEVDILLSNTLFKLLSTFCLSLLHLGMYLNERHRSYDYPRRQLDAVLRCHLCRGRLINPAPGARCEFGQALVPKLARGTVTSLVPSKVVVISSHQCEPRLRCPCEPQAGAPTENSDNAHG